MLGQHLLKLLKEAEESYNKTEPIVDQFLRSADGMSDAEFSAMLAVVIERYCEAMKKDVVAYAKHLASNIEFGHMLMGVLESTADKEQEGEDEEE